MTREVDLLEEFWWCLCSWPGCTEEQRRRLARPLLGRLLARFPFWQEAVKKQGRVSKDWRRVSSLSPFHEEQALIAFSGAMEDFWGFVAIPLLYVPRVFRRYRGLMEEFLRYFRRRLKEELGRQASVRKRDVLTEETMIPPEDLLKGVRLRARQVDWKRGLSAGEVKAVKRYLEALGQGIRPGKSGMKEFLGEDYGAVMKAISRAKGKNEDLRKMLQDVKETVRGKWLLEREPGEKIPQWRWRGLVKQWCLMEGLHEGLPKEEVEQWKAARRIVNDYLGSLPQEAQERGKGWLDKIAREYFPYWPEWVRKKFEADGGEVKERQATSCQGSKG